MMTDLMRSIHPAAHDERRRGLLFWQRLLCLLFLLVAWPTARSDAGGLEERFARWGLTMEAERDTSVDIRPTLRRALREHPLYTLEQSRQLEAQAGVREARAGWLPELRAGLVHRVDIESTQRSAFDSGSRSDAVASLSQLLWDFGDTSSRIRLARGRVDRDVAVAEAAVEQLSLRYWVAHLEALRESALADVASWNLAASRDILAQVRTRADAGAGSLAEVLRAESRVLDAESQQLAIQGRQQRALEIYRDLYGEMPKRLLPADLAWLRAGDVDEELALAWQHSAVVQRAEAERLMAQEEARAALAQRWPRLSVELSARRFDVFDRNSNDPFSGDNDVSAQLRADYALFQGGAAGARVNQARERERQAMLALEELRRELAVEIKVAANEVRVREHEWAAARLAVMADLKAVAAYRQQFDIGRRGLAELMDAQRDLFLSARRLVDLKVEWDLARLRRETLSGRLLPGLGLVVNDVSEAL